MKSTTIVCVAVALLLLSGIASATTATYSTSTNIVKLYDDSGRFVKQIGVQGLKDIVVYNGAVLYCATTSGIQVYDIHNPAHPVPIKTVTPYSNTLSIKGIYLYSGGKDLRVYSLASQLNPRLVNIKTLSSPATDSEIYNGYLYLSTVSSGVIIVKV